MKVAFVIKINFAARISTTYHLNILRYFSENHDLTIISNAESFFKKRGIKAKYFDISDYKLPNIARFLVNDSITNLKLKKIDHDLLVIWYDALIFFKKDKPVLRFVDICPYQTFEWAMKGDEENLKRNILYNAYKRSFRKSTFLITVSPQLKDLLKDYNISDEKIAWLSFGVDLERFSKKPDIKELDDFILISTVQFLPNRGRDLILSCMKKLKKIDEKIKFVSVGNDPAQVELSDSTIKEMNLQKHVVLKGVVDNKKIPEELAKSKIGISLLEKNKYYQRSPPQKIFEFMAMGLPIIANKIETHTDYIKDGYNGFIIDSEEEFIEAVLKLKKDKKLYKKMAENSLKSVKNNDLTKINKQLDKYVKKVVKKS